MGIKIKPRLRLKRDSQWNEWIVVWYEFDLYKGWVKNEDKSYHTDDKDDAISTMMCMIKHIDDNYEGEDPNESLRKEFKAKHSQFLC